VKDIEILNHTVNPHAIPSDNDLFLYTRSGRWAGIRLGGVYTKKQLSDNFILKNCPFEAYFNCGLDYVRKEQKEIGYVW
jgi:hypothetical protein